MKSMFPVFMLVLLFLLPAVMDADTSCEKASVCGLEDKGESPLTFQILSQAASLDEGIEIRVEIHNPSKESYSLSVCPDMMMCCVKGMHVMASYDDTGVGLLDVCTKEDPRSHEVFLPAKASFTFNISIPTARLPKECRTKGKEMKIFICYAYENGGLKHSNAVEVELL